MCGAWVRWETEERRKGEPVWPRLTMYWTSGHLNKSHWGNSLMVQWLGLSVFTVESQVQSLVGELRSYKPWVMAKNFLIRKNKSHWAYRTKI